MNVHTSPQAGPAVSWRTGGIQYVHQDTGDCRAATRARRAGRYFEVASDRAVAASRPAVARGAHGAHLSRLVSRVRRAICRSYPASGRARYLGPPGGPGSTGRASQPAGESGRRVGIAVRVAYAQRRRSPVTNPVTPPGAETRDPRPCGCAHAPRLAACGVGGRGPEPDRCLEPLFDLLTYLLTLTKVGH